MANTGAYTVPMDNPFVGVGAAKGEIWAYGLRNPWRWSFDRATGALWVGDVGEASWEEVDLVTRGGNYGWNTREGAHCYSPMVGCSTTGLIDPVIDYPHTDGIAVTGGYVYRGTAIPALVGTYIFGDYGNGTIWMLSGLDIGTPAKSVLVDAGFPISSFGEALDGELYVVDYSGKIWKLVPSSAKAPVFPQELSQTGCVNVADATQPADGLIPYAINAPFWSDGADKERWVALPDGATIDVLPDGDLDLPIGSVVMKKFSVGGNAIETRLLMRHDDGVWAGYSYEWDADGKDATLLLAGKEPWASSSRSSNARRSTRAPTAVRRRSTRGRTSAFSPCRHRWCPHLQSPTGTESICRPPTSNRVRVRGFTRIVRYATARAGRVKVRKISAIRSA
jgi:hypothetical protein